MDQELAGQVVVVFGAAGGIGRAIVQRFAAGGAHIVACDRNPALADVLAETGRSAANRTEGPSIEPRTVVPLVGDAEDGSHVQDAARRCLDQWGRCDHVIHAIGQGSGKYGEPFWRLSPDDWLPVWRANVLTAVRVAHVFGPILAERRSGSMIFLSSVAGQCGSPSDPPYSAAKAAIINFAQCAARDLAPMGVRVNVIAPGMVQTDLNRSVWQAWNANQPPERQQSYEAWAEAKISRVTPLGRWQEPGDVAAMAYFLASPQARNITGQTLNVDGGQIMHA